MSANAKQLESEALKLSLKDRADLADKLWLSLGSKSDTDKEWAVEIERRLHEVDTGIVNTIPHEDVVAELRARYGR